MSTSVTLSIGTNTAIAAAKGFGWFVTGSPTLFAETIHSLADVANQVLLRIGEVRGKMLADSEHPFGHGQEKYFWALVSAVSVFFVGCGLNLYHGIHALIQRAPVEPFTPLVLGLLLFALVLESFTLVVALREIGGWKGLLANRHNTTVLRGRPRGRRRAARDRPDPRRRRGIVRLGTAPGIRRRGRNRGGRAARRDGAISGGDQPPPADRHLRRRPRSRRATIPRRAGCRRRGELGRRR